MILHITDKTEFQKEIKEGKVLVDFFASWCGPCTMLSPLVEKLAKEHPEVKVVKVDVDQAEALAASFNVYSIPTLIYFLDGVEQKQSVGYIPEPSLKKLVDVK
jgi:thioredoxin 1